MAGLQLASYLTIPVKSGFRSTLDHFLHNLTYWNLDILNVELDGIVTISTKYELFSLIDEARIMLLT